MDSTSKSTRPVIEYAAVTAVICSGFTISKLATLTPPNLTLVMFTKLVPYIVMGVPPAIVPVFGATE